MHSCPRCKHLLDVVVGESRVGKTTRSIRGVCVRCWYQLSWKLIPGRLLRRPVRSAYLHVSNHHRKKPVLARTEGCTSFALATLLCVKDHRQGWTEPDD